MNLTIVKSIIGLIAYLVDEYTRTQDSYSIKTPCREFQGIAVD